MIAKATWINIVDVPLPLPPEFPESEDDGTDDVVLMRIAANTHAQIKPHNMKINSPRRDKVLKETPL